jgi:hypothetical protein
MQIEPLQKFTIWRKLEDPLDATTYYVQADIVEMRTNTILSTVNLTDQSGRVFSKEIDAPADPTFQGRQVAVVTRVYTDSGYSSLSPIHKEESREYLIRKYQQSFGGGGGVEVDYKRIQSMITAAVGTKAEPATPVDLSSITSGIADLRRAIDDKEIPITDLTAHTSAMHELGLNLSRQIAAIPQPDPVDFGPVLHEITNVAEKIDQLGFSQLADGLKRFITQFADDQDKKLADGLAALQKTAEAITNLTFVVKPTVAAEHGPSPKTPDRGRRLL